MYGSYTLKNEILTPQSKNYKRPRFFLQHHIIFLAIAIFFFNGFPVICRIIFSSDFGTYYIAVVPANKTR